MSGLVGAVLVVGGGIAGIQSSLDLAESGFRVYLLEKLPSIGGVMTQLDKTFPTNDCAMCILAPKLVEAGRHPNIEVITYADLVSVDGAAGDFKVAIRKRARRIDPEKCTGCGVCAETCIVEAIDEYNAGLDGRQGVYIRFPQAVPLVYAIDRDRCLGCGICTEVCKAGAVVYDEVDTDLELDVGSIILAPGVEAFDPSSLTEYGYGRYPNVVTSVEYERILSASGPFQGHVQRPSDGSIPGRIAFIQCVGSRDEKIGNGYCSSVCCMYATKEAVITREHTSIVEPTIFYMDMRAHGKDFDKYIERAEGEYGVRFVRCRVSRVDEEPETHDLYITYESDGDVDREKFEMVVLSVGLKPSEEAAELARTLGVEINPYGFSNADAFESTRTSRPGVLVCGTFSSPKDIPETVTQASAAASSAGETLSQVRGSLVESKEYVEELYVRGEPPRVGVFICHCGINIGGVVDVPAVVEYVKTLPNAVYVAENLYSCSSDTQEKMKEVIREHRLNRVVVASCSPRTHEPLFQETIREVGLNRYLFEMANIRDQCSWVHMREPEAATRKAKDLVRMAVAKARRLEPLERPKLSVNPRGLVIGGGLSGMTAALVLADQGFETFLVEREAELGGFFRKIHYTLEGRDPRSYLEGLVDRVDSNELIHIFKGARLEDISGYVGNFRSTIALGSGEEPMEMEHGVVIVATGGEEYTPSEYLYGTDPRVKTQHELEELLTEGASRQNLNNVVMIQCVGSRNEERPYCSRMCCGEAVKNALKVKELDPDTNVYVLYRDVRTYGLMEEHYTRAREAGIVFIRYDEERKPQVERLDGGNALGILRVSVLDPVLQEEVEIDADLLVLSTAVVAPRDNGSLAKMLKVPVNEDGFFLEAHAKLRPVDFATEGVFVCGVAHSPMPYREALAQARAAASRAITILSKEQIEAQGVVASVNKGRCSGCGLCVEVCAYNAIEVDEEERVAVVNSAMCKGCGACSAQCRSSAIDVLGFTDGQIYAVIKSITR